MKAKLRSGIVCSCLLILAPVWRCGAQTPVQQPPAQQPPPPTPTAPATPQAPKPVETREPSQPTTPLPPSAPPVRDTGGDSLSFEPLFWLTRTHPTVRDGKAAASDFPGNLGFPGQSKYAVGGVATIPTGHENSLQVSYFRVQGHGNTTLGQDSTFNSNDFYSGDFLNTSFKIQDVKVSWNYLTYPYPSSGAKFRVKTLWEVQYVTVNGNFDAPLDVYTTPTGLSKSVILPTLGMGIEYHPAKNLLLEAKASGFGLLHRAVIWDAEASAVIRMGRMEALLGGKAFHFKTSPKGDEYFSQTLYGPYIGLRYMWK